MSDVSKLDSQSTDAPSLEHYVVVLIANLHVHQRNVSILEADDLATHGNSETSPLQA
jgi:hypothetical protein